ncbi:MAG: hypothetical protein ACI808_001804 [Paraglaciecola sp.]|jgi:hypothetical protein
MMARPRQTMVSLDDTPSPCIWKVATAVRVWSVRLFFAEWITRQAITLNIGASGLISVFLLISREQPFVYGD